MKRTLSIASAALLGASLLASPVMAQDLGVSVGGSGGATAGSDSGSVSINGSTSTNGTIGDDGASTNSNTNASGQVRVGQSDDDDDTTTTVQGDVQVDTDATASVGGADDGFDDFDSVFDDDDLGLDGIQNFGDSTEIVFVDTNTFCEGAPDDAQNPSISAERCEELIRQNEARITELRTGISGNAALMAQLESENVDVSNVVAARSNADGTVTLYTR